MYKLVRLNYSESTAKRSLKYLILFPGAFIFSSGLTESTFLFFALAALYNARQSRWFYAGLSGAALALTRHIGVLIVLPLAYEYYRQARWKLSAIWLGLVPAGTIAYMFYNKHLTGDYLAFAHLQYNGIHNPVAVMWRGLRGTYALPVSVAILYLGLIAGWARKIPFDLWLYGFIYALVPLVGGDKYENSLLRYTIVIFPMALILAQIAKNKTRDELLTISLALLQGFLMVAWVQCYTTYIV